MTEKKPGDKENRSDLSQSVTNGNETTMGSKEAVETLPENEAVDSVGTELEQENECPQIDPLEALKTELESEQAKAEEYLDGWQRARAEFANYKKRMTREQEGIYQNARGETIKNFLVILDDIERALKNKHTENNISEWVSGLELIHRKFLSLLESNGIKPMNSLGENFDPNFHEAISHEESEQYESGQIIEVLQQGYMLEDRILKPAVVRVAR